MSFRKFLDCLRAFKRARDANIAMIFAISLVPISIAAGAGLDMARAMVVRNNMSEALDAAGLAVGATQGLTTTQMQTLAEQYFKANYSGSSAYGTPSTVTVSVSGQSIILSTTDAMPTTLLAIAGFKTVPITTSSTVVWGQTKLWVSLVLDNTGSMTETDSTHTSKISALQTASHQLLTILQSAATNPGDVQVSIVPFSKDVDYPKDVHGNSNVSASWLDWSDWAAPPPNSTVSPSVGPGSACPFTNSSNRQISPYGYYCTSSSTNGASTVSKVPSNGLICPGQDSGAYNSGLEGHYYNGCYNSVAETQVVTGVVSSTITATTTCTSNSSGTCQGGSSTSNSTTTNSTTSTTTYTAGYSGGSGPTTTTVNGTVTQVSSKVTSKTVGRTTTYTKTVITTQPSTATTVTKTEAWTHSWTANAHSTWAGCIEDRAQDFDTNTTAPSASSGSLFPAENAASCPPAYVAPLSDNWTALGTEIDSMVANGSTNQTIGLQHGMMTLMNSDPYNAGSLPAYTKQFIILLSDGLNTQDRWGGDGSNESSVVDARMNLACSNAKAAGITIYTVFVDLNGTQGNSTVLQNCASDTTKYFDLTTSGAIVTAFNQIATQITQLRVSK